MANWHQILATASPQQTMMRARSALGLKTVYELGKGGFDPAHPLGKHADCSGFVSWALGIPRGMPAGASTVWFNTTAYWNGGPTPYGKSFDRVPDGQAQPGDLLVYPYDGARPGHIGLITAVDAGQTSAIIHCSLGNFTNTPLQDAVQITEPGVFLTNPKTRVMRPNYDMLRAMAGAAIGDAARSLTGDVPRPLAAPSDWQPGDWVVSVAQVQVRGTAGAAGALALSSRLPTGWPLRIRDGGPVVVDRLPWWPVTLLAPDDSVVHGFVAEVNSKGVPVLTMR